MVVATQAKGQGGWVKESAMAWRTQQEIKRDREQRNRDQVQREIRDAVQNNDGGAGWGFDGDDRE